MRDDFLKTVGLFVLGLVILIGVFAAIHLLSISPIWSEVGAAWAGAIGTVATLVGTIWLATAESRRRKHSEAMRASIVAAALAPKLLLFLNQLNTVYYRMGNRNPHTDPHESPAIEARDFLALTFVPATTEELLALEGLGDNCANRLAFAQAAFFAAQTNIAQDVARENPAGQIPIMILENWLVWIQRSQSRLATSYHQCLAAARIGEN